MSRSRISLKRAFIFIHRWLGVICCLPFVLWFTSGIVLMYHEFPSVSQTDRLDRAAALDLSAIELTPKQAYEHVRQTSDPRSVTLTTIAGRPAYRFEVDRGDAIVYADDGEVQTKSESGFDLRVASDWTRQSNLTVRAKELTERDQWTVSGEFKHFEPIRKYTWPDGEQVYVSTVTGNVVQYTKRASRIGAYFGAIPHWLYFTPLRKHAQVWSRVVIYLSGLAALTVFAGIVIGIYVYSPRRTYKRGTVSSRIPYLGTKRLHTILGLTLGIVAGTWAFSGMLSMDPFPRLQGSLSEDGEELEQSLRGGPVPLAAFDGKSPRDALRRLEPGLVVKELEMVSFAGEPVYLAEISQNDVRIISVHGEVARGFDLRRIIDAVQKFSGPVRMKEVRMVTRYEAYYLDRRNRLPLPAIFIQLDDPNHSSYYIDPKTARVVESYSSRSRWNRWLYHGLHSIDLPWLYAHRPAWDIVVLTLMTGGLALIITALMLATRVLFRTSSR